MNKKKIINISKFHYLIVINYDRLLYVSICITIYIASSLSQSIVFYRKWTDILPYLLDIFNIFRSIKFYILLVIYEIVNNSLKYRFYLL